MKFEFEISDVNFADMIMKSFKENRTPLQDKELDKILIQNTENEIRSKIQTNNEEFNNIVNSIYEEVYKDVITLISNRLEDLAKFLAIVIETTEKVLTENIKNKEES
jgi:hypothetical protein